MTTTHDDVVAALGPAIAQRIGEPRYQLWFAGNTKFTCSNEQLTVGVPNRFFQEWLQNTFTPDVQEASRSVLGRAVSISFVIDPELFQARRDQETEGQPAQTEPSRDGKAAEPTPLCHRRWLTLDDFVVGPGSRLAHAAATALAERPSAIPSPLVLYGPVGVGKTHLLEGVCVGLRRRLGEAGLLFVTAEDFTNRFLSAMRSGKLHGFRHQFREAGALLVDGIHFFAHKEATQMEFLHTFEALQKHGHPVLVTSDCHPKLIPNLHPELADRLVGGVVWGIDPPDFATRVAILTAKAAKLEWSIPDDVLEYLAGQLRGNVRELEGAMHSVHHYSITHIQPITLSLAREATGDLRRHTARVIELKEIERAVCGILGLEGRVLHSKSRARTASHPRMLAMYLARKHTGAAYGEIGRFFGGRDHSTAIAADKKVRQWLDGDEAMVLNGQRWLVRDLVERVERDLRR